MQKLFRTIRTSLLYAAVVLVAGGAPLTAMADTAPTTPTPTTQSSTPSSTSPSTTPSTTPPTQTTPKLTYTYNDKTGTWDSNKWQYNPTSGTYEAVPQPPVVVNPVQQNTPTSPVTSPTTIGGGASTTQTNGSSGATTNADTTNGVNNGISSDSKSGDATVTKNTTAGDATSGNATTQATILNNVNSTISTGDNQKAASFVSNVMGDVHGDILLQPMLLKSMLEAGTTNPSQGSTTVTNTNQLTNDVNLGATSGNAAVTSNTSAGNATSGSANTVANVMNIINSMVSAKQSFVGTINIYGSLDGDILVAPDFISQLLASNGGGIATQSLGSSPTAVSAKDTQSILNNVSLAAQTGKAAVTGNSSAGSAKTGDANTNVVLFNLSGHDIVASNSLLVFVNVLGKWVGVIVDAPAGTTAAAIGNGVTSNTTMQPDLVIAANTNSQVTNNINLNSQSGDATVANNTMAGNATTGNATASANIGNITNTSMGLSGWFGILFINVFGNWNGSFGVDTAAGNRLGTSGLGPVPSRQNGKRPMRVIDFIPRNSATSQYFQNAAMTIVNTNANASGGSTGSGTSRSSQPQVTLTSGTVSGNGTTGSSLHASDSQPSFQLPWLGGITFLAGLSLVGASKLSDIRKHHASQLRH